MSELTQTAPGGVMADHPPSPDGRGAWGPV